MSQADQLLSTEKYAFLLLVSPGPTSKPEEPIPGKTWLQKEMYFLSKNVEALAVEAEYQNYLQGAYSEVIDDLLEQLEVDSYVMTEGGRISLTEKGRRFGQEVWQRTPEIERKMVQDVKELLNDLTNEELLGLAYSTFPEMKVYSDSARRIETNMVKIATSLFRRKKVSLQKAAEMAGMSVNNFIRIAKQSGDS